MSKRWITLLVGLLVLGPVLAIAQTEWVEDPAEPLLGPGGPDDWDAGAFYPTALLEVDGIYHLYYTGHREGAGWLEEIDIGHATSTDGIVWQKDPANPVLTRGADGEWDDLPLMGMTVIHDGSGFRSSYGVADVKPLVSPDSKPSTKNGV